MMEFLRMGGYGAYVWSAYGITLIVLIFNIWWARRRHAQSLSALKHSTDEIAVQRRPTVRQVS